MTDSIQPDVPTLLLQLRDCLANYRQLSTQWYSAMLPAEQKFSAGDSAITRNIESKGPAIHYAQCKKDGTLTLIHAFESAHFVPIGNTPVRLTPLRSKPLRPDNYGFATTLDTDGEELHIHIDDSGIKLLEGCKPDQLYRVTSTPRPHRNRSTLTSTPIKACSTNSATGSRNNGTANSSRTGVPMTTPVMPAN